MANLIDELGVMLAEAVNDNASLFTVIGDTGGTLHAYYGGQDDQGNRGASGEVFITYDGMETAPEDDYADSALSTFRFLMYFRLVDVLDRDKAAAVVMQAMRTVFADAGRVVLDSVSGRLGKSGQITYSLDYTPGDDDVDEPVVVVNVTIRLWHAQPLV